MTNPAENDAGLEARYHVEKVNSHDYRTGPRDMGTSYVLEPTTTIGGRDE